MITSERERNLEAQVEAQAKLLAVQASALKLAREALGKLSLYVAYNGDDWVKRNATDALAAIDEALKGE